MAYNKVTIDVEARFVDNLTGAIGKADKAVDALDKKKPKVVVSADTNNADKKIDDTGKKLDDLGKKKPKPKAGLQDNASKGLDKILDKTKSLADKVCSVAVKVRDNEALNLLSKIEGKTKSLASKAWTAVVKVKDLATAPIKKLYNSIFNLKTLIAGVVTGLAAKQFILNPINLADQYSSAKIGFSTLLGESRGQEMMDQIDEFAKATPFKTSGVISNVQKMMAYGWDVERVIKDMKTIGDAAAATGKGDQGLESIVYALSEIRSKGKLSTQELNQLASAGIKAKAYLAEGLGYGTSDEGMAKLAKDLEKGAVGANQAIDLILEGMKEFDGMMDKTANETVEGLKSQLEDTFEINIARRWGQGLQDGAKRGLGYIVSLLDEADEALMSFGDTIYDVGKELSNYFADVLGRTVSRIKEITESDAFKNASLGEKISMLWEGAIANPFADWWSSTVMPWWDSTAVPWLSEKAAALGENIGKGLTAGVLALFGASDEAIDAAGQGASIAASFVKGFVDGFDGSAVADAIGDAIGSVWDSLPAPMKLLVGGMAVGKGAGMLTSLAGGLATLAGGAAKFLGGAAAGTGLLGAGANTAIGLGAGNLAAGASISAGGLAALGLGGIASGGLAAFTGATGIYDIYRGLKDKDDARATGGGLKVGGVLSGAAIGAGIGSVVPGIGTLLGGLFGAGIGGLAGLFGAKKVKEIEAEKQSLEELTEAAETSDEALAVLQDRQTMIAKDISKRFGDVSLTMEEISTVVQSLLGNMSEGMDKFNTATAEADSTMQGFKASAADINKWNWKASIGMKFSDEDKQGYLTSIENYIANAEAVVEAQHYQMTAAVELLLGDEKAGKTIIKNSDAFYSGIQEELDGLSSDLSKKVNIALEDGEITADEGKIIADLQSKIAEITNKVANAQTEAKMEAIKIKFSSGELDQDSFTKLQEEMSAQIEAASKTYDSALEASITSLNLQLEDGAINQEEYDNQIKKLTEGYNANIGDVKAQAESIQLEILGENYEDILGEDAAAKLKNALEQSLAVGLEPVNWTQEQASTFLGIDGLSEAAAGSIGEMLTTVSEGLNLDVSGITPTPESLEAVGVKVHDGAAAAIQNQLANPFHATATVNITAHTNVTGLPKGVSLTGGLGNARGGLIYPSTRHVSKFGAGGEVSGGAQLAVLAEEGTPEMIIPLGSQRRKRGLALWEKAGHMMGVPGFAEGGLVGGGSSDEGLRFIQSGSGAGAAQGVQVNVGGVTVEVTVEGGANANIADAIREQSGEIAEEIAGILADAFSSQFENTPSRGDVA